MNMTAEHFLSSMKRYERIHGNGRRYSLYRGNEGTLILKNWQELRKEWG